MFLKDFIFPSESLINNQTDAFSKATLSLKNFRLKMVEAHCAHFLNNGGIFVGQLNIFLHFKLRSF